ncbi:MAG: hypothetical protein WKG07_05355 [Hymenobacter sp.]
MKKDSTRPFCPPTGPRYGRAASLPRLLLRMAYAQHQLGHYPAEMLYLNLALARQPPPSAPGSELVALAQRHQLVGYPSTWQQELRVQASATTTPACKALLTGAVVAAMGRCCGAGAAAEAPGSPTRPTCVGTGAYLVLLRPEPIGVVTRAGAGPDGRPRRGRYLAQHRRSRRPPARAGPPGYLAARALAGAHRLPARW